MKIYLYSALAAGILNACTHSVASDSNDEVLVSSEQPSMAVCSAPPLREKAASGLLEEANPEVLKMLEFPATITYVGLQEPGAAPSETNHRPLPAGMAYVPGGNVRIGAEEGSPQELPVFWATVKPFLMDSHPVTVDEFRAFVKATGYRTDAEKFGNAGVIDEFTGRQWILLDGATWEYPLGKSHPKAAGNHPVTQVSWADANAYARWAGKRLPSEIEWEHAARNGRNSRTRYAWGDEIQQNGQWMANIWQGTFPVKNDVNDQFAYTSPVGQFGKTELGLTDMSGNVWEWTSNRKFPYDLLFKKSVTAADISEERAQRGGSFLCEPSWCHGYRVSGRSGSTEDTSLFHLGFRCVKDIPAI